MALRISVMGEPAGDGCGSRRPPGPVRSMSDKTITPFGPLPWMDARSTPSSLARSRAAGDAAAPPWDGGTVVAGGTEGRGDATGVVVARGAGPDAACGSCVRAASSDG